MAAVKAEWCCSSEADVSDKISRVLTVVYETHRLLPKARKYRDTYIDIVGVTGSIPVAPTNSLNDLAKWAFSLAAELAAEMIPVVEIEPTHTSLVSPLSRANGRRPDARRRFASAPVSPSSRVAISESGSGYGNDSRRAG